MLDFNSLNDSNSEIYINTLLTQSKYIDKRLTTIKNRILETNVKFAGNTKEEIANFLNLGIAQNLIQTFFKFKNSSCILCKKNKKEVRQLERAHCNLYSRYDLLILAIDNVYENKDAEIDSVTILTEFIKYHKICPIYYLCNKCHKKYDNYKFKG